MVGEEELREVLKSMGELSIGELGCSGLGDAGRRRGVPLIVVNTILIFLSDIISGRKFRPEEEDWAD